MTKKTERTPDISGCIKFGIKLKTRHHKLKEDNNMMKKIIILIFTVALGLMGVTQHAWADAPIYTGTFTNSALKGYDAVSYFKGTGVPAKGSDAFKTSWRGADWLFSSQANLDAFKADPDRYAPQYGGYCAWAAAQGSLAKGDPTVYTLLNGKLYLNYNKKINNDWFPRKEELISIADKKYPDLVDWK
jgi:YHS domain-containing protein